VTARRWVLTVAGLLLLGLLLWYMPRG